MRAIGDMVSTLVQSIRTGKDVDLNALKREMGVKYSISKMPKLVEIIAALPEEHRAELLPQ
jgi:elongator complex protein 3